MAVSFDMERAGRLIARWNASGGSVVSEELARAAWRVAVGRRIDSHTVGLKLVRKHLIVQVEDRIWQRQLFALRRQLLANLSKVLGDGIVEDMEFRLMTPKIGPGRQELLRKPAGRALGSRDEADKIEDPMLRAIYKKARNKASA